MDYSKMTYDELGREYDRMAEQYNDIFENSAKEGLKYDAFCEKAHDVKEKMYFILKYMNLKKDPTVEYGKEWQGTTYPIDKFKDMCKNGTFVDEDGYGYYATETTKSDVKIIPSDVLEDLARTDFTHVIWFNR